MFPRSRRVSISVLAITFLVCVHPANAVLTITNPTQGTNYPESYNVVPQGAVTANTSVTTKLYQYVMFPNLTFGWRQVGSDDTDTSTSTGNWSTSHGNHNNGWWKVQATAPGETAATVDFYIVP